METIRKLFDFKIDSSVKADMNIKLEVDYYEPIDKVYVNSAVFCSSFETYIQKLFYKMPIDEVKDYRKHNGIGRAELEFFKMFQLSKYGRRYLRLGDRVLFYDEAYFNASSSDKPNIVANPEDYHNRCFYTIQFGFKLINPKLILFIYEDKEEYKPYLRDIKLDKID